MSLAEQIRSRVEEVRSRVQSTVTSIREKGLVATMQERLPALGQFKILGAGSSSNSSPGIKILEDIREKGVLGVASERFPLIGRVREEGILGALGTPKVTTSTETTPATPTPATPAPVPEVKPEKAPIETTEEELPKKVKYPGISVEL